MFDRAIASAPLRMLFKGLLTDGISPDASRMDSEITSNSLQVTAGEGMTVVVNKGFAICGGCLKYQESNQILPISEAKDKSRIDTIVLRLNDNDSVRSCELYVVEGTESASPIRPNLTRNGSVWEIGLADVFVTANSSVISNTKITDTRLDSERCGIINAIDSIDVTPFFAQIQAELNKIKTEYEADFTEWSTIQKTEFEAWENNEEESFSLWSSEARTEFETWSDKQKADFMIWFNNLQVILDENVAARLTAEVEALKTKDTEIEGQISDLSDDVDERISEVEKKIEGGIPTKTSDLINDGAESLSPLKYDSAAMLTATYKEIVHPISGAIMKLFCTATQYSHKYEARDTIDVYTSIQEIPDEYMWYTDIKDLDAYDVKYIFVRRFNESDSFQICAYIEKDGEIPEDETFYFKISRV